MKKLKSDRREYGEKSSYKYYYNQIANIPMLSREEERELLTKAKQGDINARNKIVMANQRFVIKIAKQYANRGIPFEDLISEGNIGLIHAVEKFDLSKDCHFLTYAVWWIRQAIKLTFSQKSRLMPLHVNTVRLIWLIPTRSDVMIRALAVQARSIRTAAVRRVDP